MRVFLGLAEIAGYYTNLERGFRELGVDAFFVDLTHHRFAYDSRESDRAVQPAPVRFARWAHRGLRDVRGGRRLARWLLAGVSRVLLLSWALVRFDVFIFGYRTTFLELWDLPILRLLGKKMLFMFHGSESRPPYLSGSFWNREADAVDFEEIYRLSRRQKRALRWIDRFADAVIDVPPQALFHERPCINGFMVGLPFAPPPLPQAPPREDGRVVILHCPSAPRMKGSDRIEEIVESFRSRGYPIDFVKVSDAPNRVVLEYLAGCDFVIDQLYSDTSLSGLACEAAHLGKPTVLGGYYAAAIREYMPEDAIAPSMYTEPEDVPQSVARLLDEPSFRRDLGTRAREFVNRRWTPRRVAERYVDIIEGRCPDEFVFDPGSIRYFWAATVEKERLAQGVREYVRRYGVEALFLDDKPAVRDALCASMGIGGE